jgi:FlaA1/EpsC-like NDP-sugar epimerase
VGAGDAAQTISQEISRRPSLGYELVGYADDDPRKLSQAVHGVAVLGNTWDITELVTGKGSRILVTGAAGSIGSELCRQTAELDPALLIMPDIGENLLGLHQSFGPGCAGVHHQDDPVHLRGQE